MASISIDTNNKLAHIELNQNKVARTVQIDENTLADLDQYDVAVGFEFLDSSKVLPAAAICSHVHIAHEDQAAFEMLIRSLATTSFSSETLSARSRVVVKEQGGHTLEAC